MASNSSRPTKNLMDSKNFVKRRSTSPTCSDRSVKKQDFSTSSSHIKPEPMETSAVHQEEMGGWGMPQSSNFAMKYDEKYAVDEKLAMEVEESKANRQYCHPNGSIATPADSTWSLVSSTSAASYAPSDPKPFFDSERSSLIDDAERYALDPFGEFDFLDPIGDINEITPLKFDKPAFSTSQNFATSTQTGSSSSTLSDPFAKPNYVRKTQPGDMLAYKSPTNVDQGKRSEMPTMATRFHPPYPVRYAMPAARIPKFTPPPYRGPSVLPTTYQTPTEHIVPMPTGTFASWRHLLQYTLQNGGMSTLPSPVGATPYPQPLVLPMKPAPNLGHEEVEAEVKSHMMQSFTLHLPKAKLYLECIKTEVKFNNGWTIPVKTVHFLVKLAKEIITHDVKNQQPEVVPHLELVNKMIMFLRLRQSEYAHKKKQLESKEPPKTKKTVFLSDSEDESSIIKDPLKPNAILVDPKDYLSELTIKYPMVDFSESTFKKMYKIYSGDKLFTFEEFEQSMGNESLKKVKYPDVIRKIGIVRGKEGDIDNVVLSCLTIFLEFYCSKVREQVDLQKTSRNIIDSYKSYWDGFWETTNKFRSDPKDFTSHFYRRALELWKHAFFYDLMLPKNVKEILNQHGPDKPSVIPNSVIQSFYIMGVIPCEMFSITRVISRLSPVMRHEFYSWHFTKLQVLEMMRHDDEPFDESVSKLHDFQVNRAIQRRERQKAFKEYLRMKNKQRRMERRKEKETEIKKIEEELRKREAVYEKEMSKIRNSLIMDEIKQMEKKSESNIKKKKVMDVDPDTSSVATMDMANTSTSSTVAKPTTINLIDLDSESDDEDILFIALNKSPPKLNFIPPTWEWRRDKCAEIGLTGMVYIDFGEQREIPWTFFPQNRTRIKRITGDGNCLFRSFCFFLTGYEGGDGHILIRKKIIDYMKEHKDDFMVRAWARMDVEDYLARNEGAIQLPADDPDQYERFGTDTEIQIFAQMMQCTVCVWNPGIFLERHQDTKWNVFGNLSPEKPTLFLEFEKGSHFNVVLM